MVPELGVRLKNYRVNSILKACVRPTTPPLIGQNKSEFVQALGDVYNAIGRDDLRFQESRCSQAIVCVWGISTPSSFRGINLFGETLNVMEATVQCFVSSYRKSQRWGAALMNHSSDLDGLVYIGPQCGKECLALFGDADSPRPYQSELRAALLGELQFWGEFWPMLDRLGVRITSMPKERERSREWTLAS